MRLFAPALAFVDLETTGTLAGADAITEVGIVRVDAHPEGATEPAVTGWNTLVNPGIPIPPESGAHRRHQQNGSRRAELWPHRR
jgi:DNA polymerase III epsilon subunit-like protein